MTGPTSIHAIIPQLLQLIEELALRPGERLPGERELAARLGWSRNTLREALTLMASRGQLEIRPRQGIFLGGSDSGDCAALLREGFGALRLVAPSLTSSVCCDCGPAELTVLEGHTATLGRALVEENFLLVWRSLTVFYLEVAKLARNRMVEKLIRGTGEIHVLRDPTRGGLATTLNEIAEQSGVSCVLEETAVPVHENVRSGCALLGLDPLYLANEGKLICILPRERAEAALDIMRSDEYGREAALIGEIIPAVNGRPQVTLHTRMGGGRLLSMLEGAPLPRIC